MRLRHDDVMKWKHFPLYWSFVRGIHRSPVNSPLKGQWHGALMFHLICARTNSWASNENAGDLRRHRAHYDVIEMKYTTGKNMDYLTFCFAGNDLVPTTNKYHDFNAALVCSVLDENCNSQCPKLKWHIRMYRTVSFWNTSLKIARASIIRTWIFGNFVCVQWCFIWHHTKFATGCRITIWALNKIAKWCDSRCSILSFDTISKTCFICMTHVYWNQGKPGPKY